MMNADSSGFSNAYVVAGFLDKRAKSRVEKRTLDPRWDFEHELYYFHVDFYDHICSTHFLIFFLKLRTITSSIISSLSHSFPFIFQDFSLICSELDESAYNELELSVWDSTLGAGRDVFLGVIHFDIYALQQAQVRRCPSTRFFF